MLVLGFGAVVLLSVAAWRGQGRSWTSTPYLWFAPTWLLAAVLLALPIFRYRDVPTGADVLYILGFHAVFAIASLLPLAFAKPTAAPTAVRYRFITGTVVGALLLLGAIGQSLWFYDSLSRGSLGVAERLTVENLRNVKAQYVGGGGVSSLGPLVVFVPYLIGLGQIGVAAGIYGWAAKLPWGRSLIGFTLLAAGYYAAVAWATTGGRLGIVLLSLLIVVAYLVAPKPRRRRFSLGRLVGYAAGASAALSVLAFFSTTFMQARIGDQSAVAAMKFAHRVEIDPTVPSELTSSQDAASALLQSTYVTTTIPNLIYYLHVPDEDRPPLQLGGFNFRFLYVPFTILLPGLDRDFHMKAAVANALPLEQRGFYANVWSTMGREVLTDFGKLGLPIFFAAFGYLMGAVQLRQVSAPSVEGGALLTILRVVALWSGFHTLLHHQLFGGAVFAVLGLAVLALALPPKSITPVQSEARMPAKARSKRVAQVPRRAAPFVRRR